VNAILLAAALLAAPAKSATTPNDAGEQNSKRYVCLSRFTDPKDLAPLLDDLPEDAREIYGVAKRQMTQPDGTPLPAFGTPRLADVLQRLKDLAPHNLRDPRRGGDRVVADSVVQSYVLTGMLRYRLIAARVRVGSLAGGRAGACLRSEYRVCEYWDAKGKRWQLLDAEIPAPERRADAAADSPARSACFEFAHQAWKRLRSGDGTEPRAFVIGAQESAFHLRRLLLRDFASLLNHDPTGRDDPLEETRYRALSSHEVRALDRLAEALSHGATVEELVSLYRKHPGLRPDGADNDPYSYVFK
jgi:hypothetical protein